MSTPGYSRSHVIPRWAEIGLAMAERGLRLASAAGVDYTGFLSFAPVLRPGGWRHIGNGSSASSTAEWEQTEPGHSVPQSDSKPVAGGTRGVARATALLTSTMQVHAQMAKTKGDRGGLYGAAHAPTRGEGNGKVDVAAKIARISGLSDRPTLRGHVMSTAVAPPGSPQQRGTGREEVSLGGSRHASSNVVASGRSYVGAAVNGQGNAGAPRRSGWDTEAISAAPARAMLHDYLRTAGRGAGLLASLPRPAAPTGGMRPMPNRDVNAEGTMATQSIVGGLHGPSQQADSTRADSGRDLSPPGQSNGPMTGDVYLDGTLMGRWMARTLGAAAARPPSGAAAFDATRARLPIGAMIGV